jgi:hypothetical protein
VSEQLNEELGKLIQKAAIDGTLSKSAVEQFNGLLVDNENLRKDVAVKVERIQGLEEQVKSLTEQNHNYAEIQNGVAEREKACADKEREHADRKVKLECAELRVADHQNMVGLIFRNSVLRKSVLGQELVAIPGTPDQVDQYGNRQYGTGREPDVTGVPVSKKEEEQET